MGRFSAYSTGVLRVKSAQGVWISDETGQRFLDGCAGTFNVGLGYGHKYVVEAIRGVLDSGVLHGSGSMSLELRDRAEQALVSIASAGLDRCHLKGCTGGSTAVEQAIRHAWIATGRVAIASFELGHHGQTVLATLASGMEFRKRRVPVRLPYSLQVPPPDCYRCPFGKKPETCSVECVADIEERLRAAAPESGGFAAFVAEPILGAGGGIAPPRKFWSAFSEVLAELEIPLILDEVQTFGRTGEFLAATFFGIEPEMVCLAKSISGIGVPGAGALLLSHRYCALDEGERSLTGGGSNLVCAAIAATIEVMKEPSFFPSMQRSAEALNQGLEAILAQYDFIGCVRGVGLMTGLEIVQSKASRQKYPELASQIIRGCYANGLLVRQSEYGRGSFVKVRPALTISEDEVKELCRRLQQGIQTALAVKESSHVP